ncbi:MAG: hypothetical protein ACLFTX_03000 [Thiohalospira sp.]
MENRAYRPVEPDYAGGGLGNLVASVARGTGAPLETPPTPLLEPGRVAEARVVVFVLVDGLGMAAIEDHPDSWLARHTRGSLTSVFPSTTTSALTTFYTGL